ncbi:hypothetical protein KQ940_01985 [Marinobacterium sp. D7]|uniref:IucA/IucC family protein n=1 Tax=Marinobacterium ramblicola TaxID=2849041 RepID=UPI001C2D8858|nr:IucA/IucC family protein [Marinobacterium ramblicola]MBV1786816.1 hypothetical protein [Marinobacterium ramblicola]
MNAILPDIAPGSEWLAPGPADHAQAARNGLFRLLRSLLREQLLPMMFAADGTADLSLHGDSGSLRLVAPRFNSLDALCDFDALIRQPLDAAPEPLQDPLEALQCILALRRDGADPAWQRIADELANGLHNEALTLCWRRHQDQAIAQRCAREGIDNLLDWARLDGGNAGIRLEQWAAVGHPYHPGSKTKLGLSSDEVWRYAPEFAPAVPLVLIGVHRSLARVGTMIKGLDYRRWFALHYPDWFARWQQQLPDQEHYLPLPVHPWQLEHDLPQRFADELNSGLIRVTEARYHAAPTLSFRTLAPGTAEQPPYIKLPVAAQMTSSVRNLSTPSVVNAPRISAVLQDILNQRPDIAAALRCQWDELGLHLDVDHEDRDDARYLAVLFRRNPCRLLADHEQAVVLAALFVTSPLSGEPLLLELMRQAGVSDRESATAWFGRYCDRLFAGVLNLYLDYGIALEAHQQNLMLVLDRQAQPVAFLNRDVGGICIHCPTLAARGWPVEFMPAATLVEDRAQARVNIFHAVLQSNIGELIELLDGRFGLDARQLWYDVARLLERYLDDYSLRYGDAARQQEHQAFFEQPWPATAFIRMRLQDQSRHAVCNPIPNPFQRALTPADE